MEDHDEEQNGYVEEGMEPIHIAAYKGDIPTTRRLLQAGVNINARSDVGKTPLHYAISPLEFDNGKIARFLIEAGADPNVVDDEGDTPLLLVCDNISLVKSLLEAGANPNFVGPLGQTQLHTAAHHGWLSTVQLLFEEGHCDIMRLNERGESAFDLANQAGNWEVAHYLWTIGALDVTTPSYHLKSQKIVANWTRLYVKGDVPGSRQCGTFIKHHPEGRRSAAMFLVGGWLREASAAIPISCSRPTATVEIFSEITEESKYSDCKSMSMFAKSMILGKGEKVGSGIVRASDYSITCLQDENIPEYSIQTSSSYHRHCSEWLFHLKDDSPVVAYFEVTIKKLVYPEVVAVGLTDQKFSVNYSLPGWSEVSFGYHSDDGILYFNGNYNTYADPFGSGDVIGCGLDFTREEAFFTKNGVFLGSFFIEIDPALRFYPTVGVKSSNAEVDFNFGQKSFVFNFETPTIHVDRALEDIDEDNDYDEDGEGEGEDDEGGQGSGGFEEGEAALENAEGGEAALKNAEGGEAALENAEGGEAALEKGDEEGGEEDEEEDEEEDYADTADYDYEKSLEHTFLPHIIYDETTHVVTSIGAFKEDYHRAFDLESKMSVTIGNEIPAMSDTSELCGMTIIGTKAYGLEKPQEENEDTSLTTEKVTSLTIHIFDIPERNWLSPRFVDVTSLSPTPILFLRKPTHSLPNIGNKLYFLFAYNNPFTVDVTTWEVEPLNIKTSFVCPCDASMVKWTDKKILFFGGRSFPIDFKGEIFKEDLLTKYSNKIYIFDGETNEWLMTDTSIGVRPHPRVFACIGKLKKDTFIVAGGGNMEYISDIEIFTLSIEAGDPMGMGFENEQLCDIKLDCGGRTINASKAVLYCRSKYFKKLIEQDKEITTVEIQDVSYELMRHLTYFFYFDTFPQSLGLDMYHSIVQICHKYAEEHIERAFKMLVMINNDSKSLVNPQLSQLFLSPLFHDVEFLVSGKICYAHKVIICSRCEYFRALCMGGLAEASQKVITIHDVEHTAFVAVLHYLYTNQVDTELIKDEVVETLTLAREYGIESMVSSLEVLVVENLNDENASSIESLAVDFELPKLMKKCKLFIEKSDEEKAKQAVLEKANKQIE